MTYTLTTIVPRDIRLHKCVTTNDVLFSEPYVEDDLDLQDEENEKKTNLILQVTAEKDSLQSDQRISQSLNEFMNSLLYRTNGQQLLRSNETYAFVEIDYNGKFSPLYINNNIYKSVRENFTPCCRPYAKLKL